MGEGRHADCGHFVHMVMEQGDMLPYCAQGFGARMHADIFLHGGDGQLC
jgi:hypothetical protein